MAEQELQLRIQRFIRSFGLLDQERTPCGQPLPTSQAHALQLLGSAEALTQQALADQLGLDKSTTSRLVAQLVDRDWVAKAVNPRNRREAHLALTERGRTALREVQASASVKYAALWQQIPPAKRPQILESLALLTDALRGT
ncbi:MAG: Transcriptional regulator, MarR family / Acetyltransferase [Firmicutes bacterium]|nr:Transcriptional regulator, MarR family / Acetyltransferase [Bacillota bacterium]